MAQMESQNTHSHTAAMYADRAVELESVENMRDLGGIAASGGRVVRRGLLFRGGALNNLSAEDKAAFYEGLGIGTVIDLRCGWEVEENPDIVAETASYQRIPLYDEQLVGLEYTNPAPGTIMIGRDLACDMDDYYRTISNELTSRQVGKAVRCMLESALSGVSAYVHCSGGKDRVGIVSFALLTMLGVSYEDAVADYVLTNVSRDSKRQRNLERFLKLAQGNQELAEQLVDSHRALPQHIDAFCESVEQRYGSIQGYLRDALGLEERWQEQAREALLETAELA